MFDSSWLAPTIIVGLITVLLGAIGLWLTERRYRRTEMKDLVSETVFATIGRHFLQMQESQQLMTGEFDQSIASLRSDIHSAELLRIDLQARLAELEGRELAVNQWMESMSHVFRETVDEAQKAIDKMSAYRLEAEQDSDRIRLELDALNRAMFPEVVDYFERDLLRRLRSILRELGGNIDGGHVTTMDGVNRILGVRWTHRQTNVMLFTQHMLVGDNPQELVRLREPDREQERRSPGKFRSVVVFDDTAVPSDVPDILKQHAVPVIPIHELRQVLESHIG